MSNECKDWLMDLTDEQISNMNLVNKYPFIISSVLRNNKDYMYEFTTYDDLRSGWKIGFGQQLLEDINNIYKMSMNKDFFCVKFVTNSFNDLDITFFYDEDIDKDLEKEMIFVNSKYSRLSRETCANCGKQIKDEFAYCKECTKIIMKGE